LDPAGTGMGLAVSKGIVEALGDTIRVEATPGGGATFVVSLPAGSGGRSSRMTPVRGRTVPRFE
jgi:signal transduction histidine kinase